MKTKHFRRPPHQGFTLIELLVVISIIALLIGILLPALGQARRTAQVLSCGTQMQQIGRAMATYTNDFDDFFPRLRGRPDGLTEGNAFTWDDALLSGGYDGRALSAFGFNLQDITTGSTVLPEGGSSGLYLCPLDNFPRSGAPGAGRSYSINEFRRPGTPGSPPANDARGISGFVDGVGFSRRVSDVTQGSDTIAVAENLALAAGGTTSDNVLGRRTATAINPALIHPLTPVDERARRLVHHSVGQDGVGGADEFVPNFLFTDGHIENINSVETNRREDRPAGFSNQFNSRRTQWDAQQ